MEDIIVKNPQQIMFPQKIICTFCSFCETLFIHCRLIPRTNEESLEGWNGTNYYFLRKIIYNIGVTYSCQVSNIHLFCTLC